MAELLRQGGGEFGTRFVQNAADLPGRPDFVWRREKLAVFVHGCYWHHCPECDLRMPGGKNAALWAAKFARNQERHAQSTAALEAAGWLVLVVWEHELADADMAVRALNNILSLLTTLSELAAIHGRDHVMLGSHNTRHVDCTCSTDTFNRMAAGNQCHLEGDQHDVECPMYHYSHRRDYEGQ